MYEMIRLLDSMQCHQRYKKLLKLRKQTWLRTNKEVDYGPIKKFIFEWADLTGKVRKGGVEGRFVGKRAVTFLWVRTYIFL